MVVATAHAFGVPVALVAGTGAGFLSLLSRSVFRESPLGTIATVLGVVMGTVAVYHGLLFVAPPESFLVTAFGSGKYVIALAACLLMVRLYNRIDVSVGEYRGAPRLVAAGIGAFVLLGLVSEILVPRLVHWIHGLTALVVVVGLYRIIDGGLSVDGWSDRLIADPGRLRKDRQRDWMTPLDDAILDLCAETGLVLTPAVIAVNLDYSREEVNRRLTTLKSRGFIERVERGKYRIAGRGEQYVRGPLATNCTVDATDDNT